MGTRSRCRTGKDKQKYLEKRKPRVYEDWEIKQHKEKVEAAAKNRGYAPIPVGVKKLADGNQITVFRMAYWNKDKEIWEIPKKVEHTNLRRIRQEKKRKESCV